MKTTASARKLKQIIWFSYTYTCIGRIITFNQTYKNGSFNWTFCSLSLVEKYFIIIFIFFRILLLTFPKLAENIGS